MSGPDRVDLAARQLAATVWNRYWKASAAGLVALAGLGLLAFGPAGFAAGVREYSERAERDHLAGRQPLGVEVPDGEVGFVVHMIRCGPAGPGEATHGRLCEATIGARNHGPAAVTIPGSRQQLAGPEGLRHLPIPGEPAPFGTLAPGAAAVAVLRYDLPPHASLTHMELHAGAYTAGAVVALDGPPLPR